MSDDREREVSRPSLADAIDLLDLVRSTEDSARISMESPPAMPEPEPARRPSTIPPASAPRTIPPAPLEEFIEVGSDAIDLPPSVPPLRLPRDSRPNPPRPITLPKAIPVPGTPDTSTAMPPAVSIVLVLGLVIGSLYAILALPSDPKPVPRLGSEPSNLQLQGRPQ